MADKKTKTTAASIDNGKLTIAKKDLELMRRLISEIEDNLSSVNKLLFSDTYQKKAQNLQSLDGKIVEGIFDGENMIDKNSKKYQVPANYASKSKLIPGDILKLTIGDSGDFIFKQIGPIERKKIVGELLLKGDNRYQVKAEGKNYNVLLASVTYFKAKPGDKITIIVPKNGDSDWAAIENLIDAL